MATDPVQHRQRDPVLEDTGIVPHYIPGKNPEEDYMVRMFNMPKEAAMGYAHTLYPEYRKTMKGTYSPARRVRRARSGLLLRMDRDAGSARRGAQPHVQRRRLRHTRPARAQAGRVGRHRALGSGL